MSGENWLTKIFDFSRLFSTPEPVEETSSANEIVFTGTLDSEGFRNYFPVHDKTKLISKVFALYEMLEDSPDNSAISFRVSREVEQRLVKTENMLTMFETMKIPKEAYDLHDTLIESFSFYYDGFACFKEFLLEKDMKFVVEAFELIFQGDTLLSEIREELLEESGSLVVNL